ncbi:MAG TPA: APC family permease [Chloroflexota bacterium]|nr:APC family permease [Chloroflexota bacterium]
MEEAAAAQSPEPIRSTGAGRRPAPPPSAPTPAPPAPAPEQFRSPEHVDILAPESERLRGTHVGDRAVRLVRPKYEGVKRLEPGVYEIASDPEPRGGAARLLKRLRLTLIGSPIRSEDESHERLSNKQALAVFGSDNISSSAYASEEIMRVLVAASAAAVSLTLPLSIGIAVLLVIVVVSYLQTIKAYPKGGGSYIVTSENLGTIPGLVAGASIQVGYVLTVAVSVSAGVAALTSAFPALYENRVLIAVLAVAIMAWGNLRGLRESGSLFAAPAYVYLAAMLGMLGYGVFRFITGDVPVYVPPPDDPAHHGTQALTAFLILRAFASGGVGLTGTEAIADGVSAFSEPASRNARLVLVVMATCFAVIFLGISFLANWLTIIPDPRELETVISQLTRTLVGIGPYYYLIQFSTALLLVLAANTAFADFPRLAYFLARDKFLPSHFAFQGARLAFSNGIIILAVVAGVLIVLFQGSVTALLPLYGIGVFTAFTLSQAALVARWWRLRERGWRLRLIVNAVGTVATTLVLVIVGITKFALGAWVVLILIPGLVALLLTIRSHYRAVAEQMTIPPGDESEHPDALAPRFHHYVLIPSADLNRATLRAISYARSLTGQYRAAADSPIEANGAGSGGARHNRHAIIQAIHVTDDADDAEQLQAKWEGYDPGVELVVVETPYRSLIGPLMRYIDLVERRHPEGTAVVTVLLPEFIPAHWWENLLHTHTALMIKGALLFRPRTAVTSVPFHLDT